jgi:CDGSH-type Zn-finger protein
MTMNEITKGRIVIALNGPYDVKGGLPLTQQIIDTDAEGQSREWREGKVYDAGTNYSLCRCGQSAGKPYCDDTHEIIGFDGTETASRDAYLDQAEVFDGPTMQLTDAGSLCAYARFCDPDGQVWGLIEQADQPEARAKLIHEVQHCPGGRLVLWDKATGQAIEPEHQPSIAVVEDPQLEVGGPIWVRGGVEIESADGTIYEVRNRVTLCRCGASENKPFCDGTHASISFKGEA